MSTSADGTELNEEGYACVLVPEKGMYQGMFIVPEFKEAAARAVLCAKLLTGDKEDAVIGALCSTLVQAYQNNNHHISGVALYAIMMVTGAKYFMVRGTEVNNGMVTVLRRLEATTTDDARKEIESYPEIMVMKANITSIGQTLDDMFRKIMQGATKDRSGITDIKAAFDSMIADNHNCAECDDMTCERRECAKADTPLN